MNKNNVIFLLFVAALLGSTWGAVVNRQKIDLAEQLRDARAELQERSELSAQRQGAPGKVAGTEARLGAAQKELAEQRRKTQDLEAKLAESRAAVQDLSRNKEAAAQQLSADRMGAAVPGKTAATPQGPGAQGRGDADEALSLTGTAGEDAQQRLEELNAQLLGLEKIVEEKSAALGEAAKEKERLQINMDVLLAKIADQQRELLASREENRELVKQLAAREEVADFQEKALPVGK